MSGACMMDESDGTGDGEWGNGILWMGNPVIGWKDTCPPAEVAVKDAGGEDCTSEMTGADAGMPPKPGMPQVRSSASEYGSGAGDDDPGRPSRAETRRSWAETRSDRSPTWRCNPWMAVRIRLSGSDEAGCGGGRRD